ncbi:MAG TPA: polysaccharide deacetylase family protein [Geobacteraceae bacterium]
MPGYSGAMIARLFIQLFPVVIFLFAATIAGAASTSPEPGYETLKARVVATYGHSVPREWGERVPGVKTRLATTEKVIALTFDACGSSKGMGVDTRLVEFLERDRVPATLFINARWIDPNRAVFDRLAGEPLFEIANHGFHHRPASVFGRSVYGINGTRSVAELVDEIELNARKIEALTGRKPRFYRSGTAYYDEVAVKVAAELGEEVAGFAVLGDAGATYSREQVKKALLAASPGDIVILHMNHPGSGTAAGVMDAVPELRKRGFRFVRLSDYPLR